MDAPSCPIRKIPLEVLLRITDNLTTPELGKFRLTCRSIEQSLHPTFAAEFFSRKQFMMTPMSLQALIDISRSRLSPYVRRVQLGLDHYLEGGQPLLQSEEKEIKLKKYYADQFTMWNSGYHREMLAEAFRNLKNLEDVVIRDFNSRRRIRDGWNAEWRSYGSAIYLEETGMHPANGSSGVYNSDFSPHHSSRIMASIMVALGDAGARPKGFEVMSRCNNNLCDFAFNIPSFLEEKLLPVLEGLEKLHLCIKLTRKYNIGNIGYQQASAPRIMQNFLLQTKNLKHLRINERFDDPGDLDGFLEWLALPSDAASSFDTPSPAYSQLEELNLGMMAVYDQRLLDVIRKFAPTLKRLELWRMNMKRQRAPGNASQPKMNLWARFLGRLREIPGLNLHHLKVGMLKQESPRDSLTRVTFGKGSAVQQYTGPDWKHFVGEITPKIEVAWESDDSLLSDEEEDIGYDDGIWDQGIDHLDHDTEESDDGQD